MLKSCFCSNENKLSVTRLFDYPSSPPAPLFSKLACQRGPKQLQARSSRFVKGLFIVKRLWSIFVFTFYCPLQHYFSYELRIKTQPHPITRCIFFKQNFRDAWRVTLRDVTQKMTKTLIGGARWHFLCLVSARCLALTRWLSFPILPLGTKFEIPRDLCAPLVIYWAGAGSPGGCHRRRSRPATPDKRLDVPYKDSGAAIPHIQKHHHLFAVFLSDDLGHLHCTGPVSLNVWCTFFRLCKRMRCFE